MALLMLICTVPMTVGLPISSNTFKAKAEDSYLNAQDNDWKNLEDILVSFYMGETTSYNAPYFNENIQTAYDGYKFTKNNTSLSKHVALAFLNWPDLILSSQLEKYLGNYSYISYKDVAKNRDPFKNFDEYHGYYKIPSQNLDWILENVFNITAVHESDSDYMYYYYNGYYYVQTFEGSFPTLSANIINYNRNYDGTYDVEYLMNEVDKSGTGYSKLKVNVCLRSVDEKKLWRINSIQRIKTIADAYRLVLRDYSWDYSYLIYDIDKDGTTELIVHTGSSEVDRKYTVYTYDGNSATKLGEIGGFHSDIYGINGDNGMYIAIWNAFEGYRYLNKVTIENEKLKIVHLISGESEEFIMPNNAEDLSFYSYNNNLGLSFAQYTEATKLHVGKLFDLSYKETDDETGTWSSSDESVARVSQNGIVSAIKKGTATITRKAENNSFITNVSVCDDSDCTWEITKIGSEYTAGSRDYVCGICGEIVKSEEFKDNLRVAINSSNLSYVKGDKIIMAVSDFVFTKEYKPGKLSLTISNDSILDVTDIKDFSEMTDMKIKMFENCRIVILEAKGVGSAWISLTNEQTGHTRKIPIVVSQDKYETIRADKIQTYEYKAWLEKDKYNAAFDGIWVSDFSCNEVSDGWNFSMNIYNENYSNAVLEVFDKDGKLIKVQIIDKFESLTKGVVDTAVAGYTVVKDAIDGDSLSFRADTISKLTSVKNLKVPQDGFIRITADSSVSANCAIVNAFDIAFTCWTFASDISEFITGIEKFDRDSADKLTKAALFKLMAQEEYLNFAKKFQDKFIGSLGTDLSLDMLVNLSNKILTDANVLLFRGLDVSFNDIVNMALGTGAGVAEGLFLKLSGPYGAILKGMFMVQDISDWTLEVNNVAKRISGRTPFGCMTPYKGTSSALVLKNDDVTVNTNGNVPNEAVMQSFRIAKGNEYVRELMKAINKPIEEYETYEIALYNDGSIVQPNGKVEVYIVSPYKSVTVYRQNADGSWEPIESRIKNGMVIFEVDHFCKFVIAEEAEPEKPSNPSSTCSHICHKGGISAFFYKIARFFWKLFKTHKYCTCGVAHY